MDSLEDSLLILPTASSLRPCTVLSFWLCTPCQDDTKCRPVFACLFAYEHIRYKSFLIFHIILTRFWFPTEGLLFYFYWIENGGFYLGFCGKANLKSLKKGVKAKPNKTKPPNCNDHYEHLPVVKNWSGMHFPSTHPRALAAPEVHAGTGDLTEHDELRPFLVHPNSQRWVGQPRNETLCSTLCCPSLPYRTTRSLL